jgi:hypothetical protein
VAAFAHPTAVERYAASHAVRPPVRDAVRAALAPLRATVWSPDQEPGAKLDSPVRAAMEHRFGTDFAQIRVHSSESAQASARAFGAAAYTVGRHIVSGPGIDFGRTAPGRYSLAHELAHVVQQRRSGPAGGSAAEADAERAAETVTDGRDEQVNVRGATAFAIACQSVDDYERRRRQSGPPRQYETALRTARDTGNWQDAADALNGFNREDMQLRLADLSEAEVGYLHQGALDNPGVGPLSAVALETAPGHPRVSSAAPPAAPLHSLSPLETPDTFRQHVRTVSAQRLVDNIHNLDQWRTFLDREISPDHLMEQTLAMQARDLRAAAAAGGLQTMALFGLWSNTNNPGLRDIDEHQIHGEWRACTGCHMTSHALALAPQDTRSWQSPNRQLAALDPHPSPSPTARPAASAGRAYGGGGASDGSTEIDARLARIAPYLQALGPDGYRVLPAGEFARDRTPLELRQAVDRSIAQRMSDYHTLSLRISSGEIDYRELRPIIDDLLPSAPRDVRATIAAELREFDEQHARAELWARVAGVALLLLAVFPPTSLFAIGVGVAAGSTLALTGHARYSRGRDLQLAEGANDVVDSALQLQAGGMVVSGVMDMASGALAIAGSIAGLRARIQSEGRVAALVVDAGRTVTRGEYTVTFAADGQSFVVTSNRYPGCFVMVDADGATAFRILNGRPVRVGSMPWAASPVEGPAAAAETVAPQHQLPAGQPLTVPVERQLPAGEPTTGARARQLEAGRLPTPRERLTAQRVAQADAARQTQISEGIERVDRELVAGTHSRRFSAEERAWLNASRRHKEIAFDPDIGTYRVTEARQAMAAEETGVLSGPVVRSTVAGTDIMDGAGKSWSFKGTGPSSTVESTADLVAGEALAGRPCVADLRAMSMRDQAAVRTMLVQRLAGHSHLEIRFLPRHVDRILAQ